MKKLLKMICCLGLCLSLSACSENKVDDAALQSFIDATLKMSELNSLSYDMDAKMNDGTQDVSFEVQGELMNSTPIQASFIVNLASGGNTMNNFMELYLTGDTQYMNFMGMKSKQNSVSEAIDIGSIIALGQSDLTVDILKPYLKEASQDGDQIHLEIDMDKVSQIEDIKEAMAKVSYKNILIDVQLKDGYISEIKASVEATEIEASKKATFSGTVSFDKFDQITAITFPEFNDYVEVTE